MNATARLRAALYAPSSLELVQPMPGIADGVHERLHALRVGPAVAEVDVLLRDLGGLTASLMKLRLALVRESELPG